MDSSGKRHCKLNPRENASLLSKVTFFFTYTIFRQGLRRDLEEDDIYEIVKSCSSTTLGNRLEKEWEKEKKKRTPQCMIPILKIFGPEYALLGLALMIVETSLMIAKPLLIGKIVSYFTPNQTELTQNDTLKYSAALIGCILINIFFIHSYLFGIEQLGLRVKGAICALIYRKSLKLNSSLISQVASGQAVTLMTKDVCSFDFSIFFANHMFIGTIQLVIMTFIMYKQIGISAVVGTSLLLLFIPILVCLGKTAATYKLKTAAKTDQRVQVTQEILNAIRIIKMYTWEAFFLKSVNTLRRKEIHNLRILFYIRAMALSIGQLSSKLALYACVMMYVALGYHITAEKAFIVTGSFEALRSVVMYFIPIGIAQLAELKASTQRITNFLQLEEVPQNHNIEYRGEMQPKISIKNVTVTLDKGVEALRNISLEVQTGLTMITGPVGAGKSTLLKLILGETRKTKGIIETAGNISYASQEPWLFPGTIRQNIIFGEWFDQKRYEAVINVCALRKDLETLSEGDMTCLTDKGLNLSRGQKTRINLARAVYKLADIYLLDDCLSAVDTHVAKHIFYSCIKGILKDTICIVVTHQEKFLSEVDNIIVINNGCLKFQGNYSDLNQYDGVDRPLVANKKENYEKSQLIGTNQEKKVPNYSDDVDESTELLKVVNNNSRKIYQEDKEQGSVKKEVYYRYFMSGGGLKMIVVVVFFAVVAQIAVSWTEYFVSSWVDMEQKLSGFRHNQTTNSTEYKKIEQEHGSIMKQYSFIILAATAFTLVKGITYFAYCCRISINIHDSMFNRVITAAMTFFDTNLSGNILNRFSRDLGLIDELMPYVIFECSLAALILISVLIVVSMVNPLFLIPSGVFAIILVVARRLYIPTGRSIRRLQGTTRSAVIGHLNASLEGLTTIRANQAQNILRKEFDKHQDLYNSTLYMSISTTRAFGFYLDTISVFYIGVILLTFLFVKTDTLAGKVGLAITQSLALTGLLQWGVRQWAELENQMTLAERALEYTNIESEEKSGDKVINWPNNGQIIYSDVNLRYSPTTERVLKNITFVIEPKHKVGIVGRTGAGKSSIISTLYRMYEYRGTITIDGININNVALEFLRSKISVIPQDPVLFSGTIRTNLDPNEEYSDKELWDALDEVEMKAVIISLNSKVFEGGANFSIGQRQLICLARAILSKNRILVLDEATANVDPETDSLIQNTVRKRFHDCTIVTIAHRLHTVMDCDRVLVMEAGMMVEYDHPKVLLSRKNGLFYKMVKEAESL